MENFPSQHASPPPVYQAPTDLNQGGRGRRNCEHNEGSATPTTLGSSTGERASLPNSNMSLVTGANSPSPHKRTASVTSMESLSSDDSAEAILRPPQRQQRSYPAAAALENSTYPTANFRRPTQYSPQPPSKEVDEGKKNSATTTATTTAATTTTTISSVKDASMPAPSAFEETEQPFSRDSISFPTISGSRPQSPNNSNLLESFNTENLLLDHQIEVLTSAQPLDIEEYITHLNKLGTIIYENKFDQKHQQRLFNKLYLLMDSLEEYVDTSNPLTSQLYLLVEQNFDLFIKLATNYKVMAISTAAIRFLTTVVMNLNYWEIYNLLNWKPVLYHFLNLINFDLNESYRKFISDYQNYSYDQVQQPIAAPRTRTRLRSRKRRRLLDEEDMTPEERERTERFFSLNPDTADHDKYVADILSGVNKQKRKFRPDVKLEHHKIIKKPQPPTDKQSNKSSNYDPDVVHECQLPSAEVPHKLCLRRFSRKYELIRHQETVHSKKKKLFKCYVCVKQNPGVGPRIFTRHDTLAKHIRVNHEIFGKEAKAEVAYSKKHAEVVEEGDITVHVGRRKTKVDFELRAHMDKNGEDGEGMSYLETSDLDSGDEEVVFNNR
ncbi:uncharacterized protein LODBEIA_P45550 [Lodderomyces beijingensis]|uniref:C2H2-type domain-containing protein n=1 Tax=Lodderomyces beijingensis TaxID=1775926 RepID=A0ABP0ZQ96_9ASCO